MSKIYFDIDEKIFEKIKQKLREKSIESDINDATRKNHLLIDAEFQHDEMYLEDKNDELFFNTLLRVNGYEIGYLSMNLSLSQEVAIEVIDKYIKKLNKLKTILEATK